MRTRQIAVVLVGFTAAIITSSEATEASEHDQGVRVTNSVVDGPALQSSSPRPVDREDLVESVDGPWTPADQATMRSDVEADAPEVEFLVRRHGITVEEAWRRLELAAALGEFASRLDEDLGKGYGGAWLDHENGGRIHVGVRFADQVRVQALARDLGIEDVVIEARQATIGDLEALQRQIELHTSAVPGLEVGGIHAPSGTVEILVDNSLRSSVEGVRSAPSVADDLVQELGDSVRIRKTTGSIEVVACAPKGENRVWCDPPLRGGVGITGSAACSGAFNTRSRPDGAYYFMTAGHCGAASRWDTRDADFVVYQVGPTHSLEWNNVSDSMIIRVLVPSFWDPAPWVFVTGDDGQAYNESRIMRAVGTTTEGMPVCMTGRMGGTECGEVVRRGTPGARITDAAEVEGGCIRGGDSGGSVYSGTTAYGIVHAGRFRDGDSSTCSLSWYYQGISEALERRNVRLIVGG